MLKLKDKKIFKHQLMITASIALTAVVTMLGGSYALFSSTSKADEYNVLKVGELEISYVDTGEGYGDILSLNGAYPMSDSDGEKQSAYRFNITNTGTITADFKIKILYDESIIEEDDCSENLLNQSYIKYKFDNATPVLLSSKQDSNYVIYEANNLLPGSSEIHEIRIWIDENSPNAVLGKHFHGKVVIESTQAGIDDSLKKAYAIGEKVTLKDGSSWHVLEKSTNTNTMVTLLSDYNLNSDGTYNTTCGKDTNDTTVCSPMSFDTANNRLTENNSHCVLPETGCNIYSQNGSTVIKDSTVKSWLDLTYYPLLKQALTTNGGTAEGLTVTLPTMEQLAKVDSSTFNQTQVTFASSFLTTTSYWTKTPSTLNSSYVWAVVGEYNNSYFQNASDATKSGVRPVITVSKLNITTNND